MSATRNLIPEIGSIIKAKGKISNFGYLTRNNKTYYTVLLYNVETNNKKIDHLWLVANENFISQNPGKGDTIIFETTIHPYRNRKGIKNLGATRFKLIKIANRQNKLSIKEYIEKVSVAKGGK
jgi:hypothetical protein